MVMKAYMARKKVKRVPTSVKKERMAYARKHKKVIAKMAAIYRKKNAAALKKHAAKSRAKHPPK